MDDLAKKLLDKSQEAFIVAIELYNKPTIRYRVEGFSFFICNAWELLLKAHMIQTKGEESIYYKDKRGRTLSLENCIRAVFTNDKDPLRKNLEKIVELRNVSTHFIMEEYEQIYVPLFQSCVLNYVNKLLQFFGMDITEHLGSNFLALSVKLSDLSEEEIQARYPKQIADRIVASLSSVQQSMSTINNQNFAIPVRHDYYITKRADTATVSFSFTKDADKAALILKESKDRHNECPYTTANCIDIINKRIARDNLEFISPTSADPLRHGMFNKRHFQLFVGFYSMKDNEKYCYKYSHGGTTFYSYSMHAIDFIYAQIADNPSGIIQAIRENIKK